MKKYEAPELTIKMLSVQDVIATSDPGNLGPEELPIG